MSLTDDRLGQPLSAWAFCWRLDRRDGVSLGLTSHDRPLHVDGFLYMAAPGLVPSAIESSARLEPATMHIDGMLSSDAIAETDLSSGRWDGAAMSLHMTEWTAPGEVWLELMHGELGEVRQEGAAFSVELKGPASVLQRPVAPSTSACCRAELGDRQCRVPPATLRRLARADRLEGSVLFVAEAELQPGILAFGSLRWLSGANAGFLQPVIDNDMDSVMLLEPPPFAIAGDERLILVEGCDKQIATCRTRFANAVNFRGEPFLPGTDLLTRYPGN